MDSTSTRNFLPTKIDASFPASRDPVDLPDPVTLQALTLGIQYCIKHTILIIALIIQVNTAVAYILVLLLLDYCCSL